MKGMSEDEGGLSMYKSHNPIMALGMYHPRRPRGSQSGREKRRGESF